MSVIDELLDESALMSFEHQEHMLAVLGEFRWDATFRPPSFRFTGDRTLECTGFHVLGSAAPGPQSWLWSWANKEADYLPELVELALQAQAYGVEHGISLLVDDEVPFADLPGSPTDPVRVAWMMGELVKAVTHTWTMYNGNLGRGSRIAIMVEHPDLELPPPSVSSMSRIVDALDRLQLPDHRHALHRYAVVRGLGVEVNDAQSTMSLTGPDFETVVRFSPENLLVAASTSRLAH
ncbi:DUF6882 domain-containing protein [Kibdelosporangium phytohabitans]|uniref:Uncharacterized protein n=1 Tax=Kibdelosporangium phytohabitans TaxID=860235 RepID=A0A0N9IH92_9PSEU|nr:DUF6882 domain-containing protein [Kibdelosporangium phytohabitans]ALG14333.1 hypothetical protein AOZ06_52340 [Kibdelosporangium phytohabitans]MBE1466648.1 hypothetical protein [Kibdelosporangium phytohabitans]